MASRNLQVLTALDGAKTQWYHFTAVVIAGMGFFTKMLGRIYYHKPSSLKPGMLPPNVSAAINGVALVGTLAGQLFYGCLGDKLGRKKVYGITLMLMCLCSIASGLSFWRNPKLVMATLCFFRFWLGFGIGDDYPSSATIMSEYSNKKTRRVYRGAGGMFAIIMSSVFDARFKAPSYEVDPIRSTVPEADYVWRIILMVGAFPALLTYYWRMKMPETARYTALVAKQANQPAMDMSKVLQMEIPAEQQKIAPGYRPEKTRIDYWVQTDGGLPWQTYVRRKEIPNSRSQQHEEVGQNGKRKQQKHNVGTWLTQCPATKYRSLESSSESAGGGELGGNPQRVFENELNSGV
ncbi:General substrate transporter [Cynara cardunculus var. scolymus]|uniref:General substrate transporter n=1 Tax=Cynara cardunculus var. scolymus TaxID=59895 RepID=A0A103YE87_CYNCS|nr:General substrate transporter [Cynara cardunculus var. scolymus]